VRRGAALDGEPVTDLRALDLGPAFTAGPFVAELPAEIFVRRVGSTKPMWERTIQPVRELAFEREPDLPEIGSVLGKYRLERAIGIGGFGAVYRARHVVLDTVVAIKLMRPSIVRQRPVLTRLLTEEARFAARIDHEHVVRVYDVTRSEQGTYIVMEYVDGPDLAVMIKRRGALPARMVVRLIRHISQALAAGLDEQLIHRDIKPSNILLTPAGVTKLADFGLARSSSTSAGSGIRGVVGTMGYMSPEQLDDPGQVDFRSDIYSLGVTAYHALTGVLPFPDDDSKTCAEAHRSRAVLAPNRVNYSIPTPLSGLIMRMLAKQPADRPASYAQLDAELRDLATR
jgi:eukaryotic-like serine/threonine-protein kinase